MSTQYSGKQLTQRWHVSVSHALYRKTGDWYHQLRRFPGALFDANGYVVFETSEAFHSCPWLRIRQDVAVPEGIAVIPGYVQVVIDGKERDTRHLQVTTYERAAARREGKSVDVILTRYERDPAARAACLEHYGFACVVCKITFAKRYGEIGKSYIHVHHLEQLAHRGEREVDPIKDLRPVCPNCHVMLHRRTPPLSIAELKEMLVPIEK